MNNESYLYVALIDVLAYRSRLQKDRDSGTLSFKDELQRAMTVLSEVNEADFPYQAISDTIIVSCARRDEFSSFLILLKKMYASFLNQSLLIRGGVAFSQHFKSSNVTYSHALALAYELESQKAIYPRIIIDPNIILMLDQLEIDRSYKLLIAERNGAHFVNVADKDNWSSLYEAALRTYEKDAGMIKGNEEAFQKHLWLQEFLLEHPCADKVATPYIPPTKYGEESTG